MMFGTDVTTACKAHALTEYPNECCGVVVDGAYVPLLNVAAVPAMDFQLSASAPIEYQAVLHSHCAPAFVREPSVADMAGQIETAVPWGIVLTDGKEASGILWWGDFRLDEPLIGSSYHWYITDCWSVIRRWHWQTLGIKRQEFPRDYQEFKAGGDLFRRNTVAAGLHPISADEAKTGDVVFMTIRGSVANHCGVIVQDQLLLHHLPGRLSCREPIGRWKRLITDYLRFEP
jgi:cell wall-associated NlpC family hydrolase